PISLLDIGAADGKMLSILNSKLSVKKAVGIEPSVELSSANKDTSIIIINGIGEELPFDENEFDVVVLASVIEHVKDVKKTLAEVYRVVKEEGIVIITAVNPFIDKLVTFLGFKSNDHLRTYSLSQLKQIFVENGFVIMDAKRFGPFFYNLVVGIKK
ncbi:MAG: class I SAM-dependent methyltransferase, partial [Endomicrobia bacterium]|nr:class I SAM-dependent methyltransferase [Endomicrobiia bacterium]